MYFGGSVGIFLGFIDESAVFAAGQTLRGREAIGEAWSVFFGPDARAICWEPTTVELSGEVTIEAWVVPANTWKLIFDAGVEAQMKVADTPACMASSED